MSIVRNNLLSDPTYSPYCGNWFCSKGSPRTKFSRSAKQFSCSCGWVSDFEEKFISELIKFRDSEQEN